MSCHEKNVADRAAAFAAPFDGAAWASLLGRWHDLGKYSLEFQHYLLSVTGADSDSDDETAPKNSPAHGPDHSTAGAQHAAAALPRLGGVLLAYLLAGHHAGLPNGRDADSSSCLEERLKKAIPNFASAPQSVLAAPAETTLLKNTPLFALAENGHATAFFLRMLFSALVDADFLDTEAFMDNARAAQRAQLPQPTIAELAACLRAHMQTHFGAPAVPAPVAFAPAANDVQHARAGVLRACLAAAEKPTGLFTLTVPTGGGKTLASLSFALEHARRHGLERVIYVIPFTSIIEQNAQVFRDVFARLGADTVLEHHSNLDIDAPHHTSASRLASENWDARLIVTTNVQFFESLHARETSRCRKLHRLARSVIILDEAQTLPVGLMQPCLRAIEQLAKNYGSTVVLCTATQPAIARTDAFTIGLDPSALCEIIPDPARLHTALKRVRVRNLGTLSNDALAEKLASHPRVLCIVSTRAQAREIHALLLKLLPSNNENVIHLSALMCPEHRSEVIDRIRALLRDGKPCRVVSTSLIEAGVNLDFPVVYRALAGLDSIAQAAGRCNREGLLAAAGDVFVFCPEKEPPSGFMRETADAAAQVLDLPQYAADPLSLEAVRHYFSLYYWKKNAVTDEQRIMDCFPLCPNQIGKGKREDLFTLSFRDCSEKFRLIDSAYQPVIVPWKPREPLKPDGTLRADGHALCEELRRTYEPSAQRLLARRLQRFTVAIPQRDWNAAKARGLIGMVHERFPLLASTADYSPVLGLQLHIDQAYDPESLIETSSANAHRNTL